jgi:hypothetical protein
LTNPPAHRSHSTTSQSASEQNVAQPTWEIFHDDFKTKAPRQLTTQRFNFLSSLLHPHPPSLPLCFDV